ncbi:tRNA-aminoacylation cofactor ARC1 [Cyberlindnera fabianii]|uniref:tRNA-aminoacylation cofactor ARC1 n=1 Tax=Cyberlindnera fabianii TaxID=36022 RepID=A0A1V2L4X0_CYBFA|nr:tRNA-aminoacylation cofactor ARC1 [Cyberlindnera fabianii]
MLNLVHPCIRGDCKDICPTIVEEKPSIDALGDELIWEGIEDVSELDESGEKKRLSPKAWKKIQKKLFTDEIGNVTYEDEEGIKHKLVVKASGQPVGVKSAFNAVVR